MRLIAPNLYTFTGLVAGRVYAIADEATVTLVDAGLGLAATRVLEQLQHAGYAPEQVTRIVITHAHSDHVGGLPMLHAATGAPVSCGKIEKPVLEGDSPVVMPDESERKWLGRLVNPRPQRIQPVPVEVALSEGDVFDSAIGPLQVIGAPGHTPGQIALWQQGRKILFCGDAMMHVNGIRLPFSAFTQSMKMARATVKRLVALNPDVICFGHGEPLKEKSAEKLRHFADRV